MSSPSQVISSDSRTLSQRCRSGLISLLFLASRRFPQLLHWARNENSWTALRVGMGLLGAALVILPLGLWNGWITALFGLALFVTSILLPSAPAESLTDRKARELGAQTVVSGGEYQPGNAPATAAELFIGKDHIWALGRHFEPLLVITIAEISAVRVVAVGEGWNLQLRWADHKAEFRFDGMFAERLAELAASSIRSVCQPASADYQSRAAGA